MAQTSALDAGIAHIRDHVMPTLLDVEGCVGLSLLVDRSDGRCIGTSSWHSEEAMHSRETTIESMRNTAAAKLGGSVEKIETWEIAVMHREHRAGDDRVGADSLETRPVACVRCTWLQCTPEALARVVDEFKAGVLPEAEQMDGFSSASLLVDRDTGRAVSATAWDSREAMERGREHGNRLHTSAALQIGAEVLEVREFDLAIAHLRAPEAV